MKKALITGITGQDGSYLADFLLGNNYKVYGLIRRTAAPYWRNIETIKDNPNLEIIHGDITDSQSLFRAVEISQPDEVYNLAAHSFVGTSWEAPETMLEITGVSVGKLLNAVRCVKPNAKVYHASSSEMFGETETVHQNEDTKFNPRSPYGTAKVLAHNTAVNYRESYGMFVCCGILFNHESPRRGLEFVTQKIATAAARIKLGLQFNLQLGNIYAKRDWGYAPEYIEAMHLMLQQDQPRDYVIGTGYTCSVNGFADYCFGRLDLDCEEYVTVSEKLKRPADISRLVADPSLAGKLLGWHAKKQAKDVAGIMTDTALTKAEIEKKCASS